MLRRHGRSKLSQALLLSAPLLFSQTLYAAKPIELDHQNISILQSFISAKAGTWNPVQIKEINRSTDFKQTLHVRFQETYAGYDVYGADGIVHIPMGDGSKAAIDSFVTSKANDKASMDGTIYQDINVDLANTPSSVFSQQQSQNALSHVINDYQHKIGNKVAIKDQKSKLIVFIDDNNKAHWAYHVSFYVDEVGNSGMPEAPNAIVDAVTFKTYRQWNDIKTIADRTDGGGFGGNSKMKVIYDGLKDHLDKLRIVRDNSHTCYLQNDDVTVRGYSSHQVVNFNCQVTDPNHNNVYWDGELEAVNGGYSPPNDALFGGAVIKDMYQQWYGVPVLTKNGKPMMLSMVVHAHIENAYWNGREMTFGDGRSMFYPLTSLGVAAHEISHGFTQQHSNLSYYGQSGGMNEAFSDMAAQAAEYFAYGKASWQIGGEIMKAKDRSLRYLDKPSRDCYGKKPGNWCSIDSADQYNGNIDVHFSSGVYNHFFYALGTANDWNARKAFDVMVHANANYWTSSTNFAKGACGVIKAATDLGYDLTAVKAAFDVVKIDYSRC